MPADKGRRRAEQFSGPARYSKADYYAAKRLKEHVPFPTSITDGAFTLDYPAVLIMSDITELHMAASDAYYARPKERKVYLCRLLAVVTRLLYRKDVPCGKCNLCEAVAYDGGCKCGCECEDDPENGCEDACPPDFEPPESFDN